MGILWDDDAWDDYLYWQTQDKKTLKRMSAYCREAAGVQICTPAALLFPP